jgi:hypothetical protein
VATTPADYGFFPRKILSNQLYIGDCWAYAVCTNPDTCATAVSMPILLPRAGITAGTLLKMMPVGDGPSVNRALLVSIRDRFQARLTWDCGRDAPTTIGDTVAFGSVSCGRLIRKAWLTERSNRRRAFLIIPSS